MDKKLTRHPDFVDDPAPNDAIVVADVMMVPVHGGRVIPCLSANESAVHVLEHKPGKHCVVIVLSRYNLESGFVCPMSDGEVDKMVQLLLDAKDNAIRLNAGGEFVQSAPLGGRQ